MFALQPSPRRSSRIGTLATVATLALLPAMIPAQIVGGQPATHLSLATGGTSGACVGDVNGDGTPDFVVSYGSQWGYSTVTVFSGRTGLYLWGYTHGGEDFGESVAGIGDVNGDGVRDVLVGVPAALTGWGVVPFAGSAVVCSGRNGQWLRIHSGQSAYDDFGLQVSGLGDLNGDGVEEYTVSAPSADPRGRTNAGSLLVYDGKSGRRLHAFHGRMAGAGLGYGRRAGDVDGDGVPDLVFSESDTTGRIVRVVSGSTLDQLWSVAACCGVGVGDVDRDGFDDIAVSVFVSFGQGSVQVHSGTNGALIHTIPVPGLVGPTGDVNGDGFDDFGIHDGTRVNVHSGRDAALLLTSPGEAVAIDAAGDVDGDGFDDVFAASDDAFSRGFSRVFGVDTFVAPSTFEVSATAGGTVEYAIDFPDVAAGQNYLVLMSASGTGPFRFGVDVPLTIDALTTASLQGLLAPIQAGFLGTLSPTGTASAALTVPPNLFAGAVGLDLQLAAVAFPNGGLLQHSSSAIRLTILP